jgi:hypothetical protein
VQRRLPQFSAETPDGLYAMTDCTERSEGQEGMASQQGG